MFSLFSDRQATIKTLSSPNEKYGLKFPEPDLCNAYPSSLVEDFNNGSSSSLTVTLFLQSSMLRVIYCPKGALRQRTRIMLLLKRKVARHTNQRIRRLNDVIGAYTLLLFYSSYLWDAYFAFFAFSSHP